MDETIRTARLTLRPLAPADAPAIETHVGARDVARMLTVVPHPYPPGLAAAFVARAAETHARAWAVDASPSGGAPLIGCVTWRATTDAAGAPALRLGYWIGRPWQGFGYGTEAAGAAVDAAFADPARDFVEAGVHLDNPASRRVLEKLGFAFADAAPLWNAARGEAVAFALGRLDRARWAARRVPHGTAAA
jgi:RimJ/RimL family protein N-acetyltransferase